MKKCLDNDVSCSTYCYLVTVSLIFVLNNPVGVFVQVITITVAFLARHH